MDHKHILICSIFRDAAGNIEQWFNNLGVLIQLIKDDYIASVSFYENDSIDSTPKLINSHISKLSISQSSFVSEKLRNKRYTSIWSYDRLKDLAYYRQKCLNAFDLNQFDKIAYIESDILYDPEWCKELILAKHPASIGKNPDIYSGWSLRSQSNPKECMYLYDTCATRLTKDHTSLSIPENEFTDRSFVRTPITGYGANCLHQAYSTFNCFCVYNAEPFKRGVKWNFLNERLNTGQTKYDGGWLDADTAVMCEDFHKNGFSNIFINKNCIIQHL